MQIQSAAMPMKHRRVAAAFLVLLANCGGNAPAPVSTPSPAAMPPAPTTPVQRATGSVRVNVSMLNIREEASTAAAIVGHARRGERLTVIGDSGDWLRVTLNDGTNGWVSSQLVVREGAAARPRRSGCPPDTTYSFVEAPKPSFSENGPHGMVVVEASVDTKGIVTSTRVVSNETHDDALAAIAEKEVRNARFAPPIRNCALKAFFFTYKRAF
jgi:uncharacterized protein YgiM (DUF1202 family)